MFRGLVVLFALSAGVALRAERLPIKAYTTADGLPNDVVMRIVTDSRGFLWFCTKGGLARFDGYSFVNFGMEEGLPAGGVNDLLETRTGEYWVATEGGLAHFTPTGRAANSARGTNPNATPMFVRIAAIEPEDRFTRTVTVIREGADGTVWVGTRKGLYRVARSGSALSLLRVDIGMPSDMVEQGEVADLCEDRFGTLWAATPAGLYRRWSDGTAARYLDGLPGKYLSSVFEDHEGRFWVGTREAGFFGFSADATHAPPVVGEAFSLKEGLPNAWVNQVFETTDHRFWIAGGAGLAEFFPKGDAQDRRLHIITERNGLVFQVLQSIAEDRAGNLWLSTTRAGAMKLARDGFTTYGRQDGIANIEAILQDRAGDVCFRGYVLGDDTGSVFEGAKLELTGPEPRKFTRLGCFDGHRFDWFEPPAVKYWGWVLGRTTLQARSGEFWLGTEEGLMRFAASRHFTDLKTAQPRAVYTPRDGLASAQVSRLFEDSGGNIWISTTASEVQGLARWDARSERVVDLGGSAGLPPLREELPRSFGEDASHHVWVGFGSGVARYADGAFTFFGEAEGLPAGAIKEIHLDRAGRLWLASDRAGLIRVDRSETARPTFVSYTTVQGLSGNALEFLVEDPGGFLYTGGGLGLDRFDPSTGRVRHYTAADGLPPGLLTVGFCDRAGVLWFGSSTGLARLVPWTGPASAGPQTLISAVRVTGIPQAVPALGSQAVSLGEFAPEQNQVEIDFVGLGLGAGEMLRYQYKLEGAIGDWSVPSGPRTVNFRSLAPGSYRFLVRAINSEGAMSGEPASLTFTILRPIWLRWWFLALEAALVSTAALALYRYRVARVLELAAIRTRIATDLHDDIGANLTRISLLSEVASRRPDDASLMSIGSIARESVGAMSDIVWAINPKHENLADLISRMRRHGEEVFTLRDITLTFHAPAARDTLRLGMDLRRDLLLIYKEAVSNAARHSRCSQVSIDLSLEHSRLILTVADNGVGFDTTRESTGNGLASLTRRAERLKGTIDVRSSPNKGTTVILQVPL